MSAKRGNFIGLLLVTAAALVLMVTVGLGSGVWNNVFGGLQETDQANAAENRPVPVAVTIVQPERVEITATYTGRMRELERYTIGFQVGGDIVSIAPGPNNERYLDVGDSVQAGQLLAKMDSVEYEARMVEAQQNLERSQAEYNRAVRAREEAQRRGVPLVITDDVFDTLSATKGVQEQLVRIAEQRLKDTRLIAPVNGKISARYKAAGELVNANEPVFEIVEVDQLLLVVGVPESRIHEIRLGQTVYIDRHATDYFGRKFALLEGTVHKVAAAAHESTGWFDIEVIVDNSNGELKPGLIADARIVIDELQGVRLPQHAAVTRGLQTYLFYVDAKQRGREYAIQQVIYQNGQLIIPSLPSEITTVVIRGQRRLVDGRPVEIVDLEDDADARIEPTMTVDGQTIQP